MTIDKDHFAEYVRELREFSGTHGVPFGEPLNLQDLLDNLKSSQAFASDFGSMIRSIVFQERFKVAPSELLILVAVAWGGEEVDPSSLDLSEVLRDLQATLYHLKKNTGKAVLQTSVTTQEDSPEAPLEADGDEPKPQTQYPTSTLEGWTTEIYETNKTFTEPVTTTRPRESNANRAQIFSKIQIQLEPVGAADGVSLPLSPQDPALPAEDTSSVPPFRAPLLLMDTEAHSGLPRRPVLTEILTLGLTGLAAALLAVTPTMPLYRTHISVYLPSKNIEGVYPKDLGSGSDFSARFSLEDQLLHSGKLTQQVEEHFLLRTHANPIFRQDVLSRGMRALHLGGDETILYATLVSETGRQVNVRELEPKGLYEITCDSWNSQFAIIFCNELGDEIGRQLSGQQDTNHAGIFVPKVEAATGPGVQIFPHWYLLAIIGFGGGCLAGALLGFAQPRRQSSSIAE